MSQTNTMEYAHNAISLSLAFLTAIFPGESGLSGFIVDGGSDGDNSVLTAIFQMDLG